MRDYLWTAMVRLGFGRDHYRISPGLYALGQPDTQSPVLVTCNFKLTFDILRRKLAGHSYWLLVVETYGINVWCAAGKKSFSTEEVARKVKESDLDRVVSHRTLIVPQLAGPGWPHSDCAKSAGFPLYLVRSIFVTFRHTSRRDRKPTWRCVPSIFRLASASWWLLSRCMLLLAWKKPDINGWTNPGQIRP
jgi:hypothetical protein